MIGIYYPALVMYSICGDRPCWWTWRRMMAYTREVWRCS